MILSVQVPLEENYEEPALRCKK